MTLMLGRLPAVRPHGLKTLSAYATKRLPAPPKAVEYGRGVTGWGMDANDRYGCCTIAGAAHLLAAWDSEVSEHDPVPNADDVIDQYLRITGGQDTGCVEADVLSLWHRSGLFGGAPIAGYAPVDPRDIIAVHQAIAFYGGAYLGVTLPESAEEQFADGARWTVEPGSPVLGGHCVVAVGYDSLGLSCVTWGKVARVTYPWLSAYMDECWAIVPHQFVEAARGPALDLESLEADLAAL
ncbi:MAG TPA: hypothetical protein VF288_10545 [Mycobacteriales bacterium]